MTLIVSAHAVATANGMMKKQPTRAVLILMVLLGGVSIQEEVSVFKTRRRIRYRQYALGRQLLKGTPGQFVAHILSFCSRDVRSGIGSKEINAKPTAEVSAASTVFASVHANYTLIDHLSRIGLVLAAVERGIRPAFQAIS